MTVNRRRNLVRTTAVAAVAGSAMMLPAAAAFADGPRAEATAQQPENKGDEGKQQKDAQQKGEHHKGERKPVRTQALSGGFTAKIYKLGPDHFQADMYGKDPATGKPVKMDTLETRGGKPAYGQHNGAHFVLQPDGSMTSWVQGGDKNKDEKKGEKKGEKKHERKPEEQKGAKKGQQQSQQNGGKQTQVTPKGGVKAGAEGVGGAPETSTVLLAGGGAAAAAAGLGFALLHRRKAREDA
ncbi:hypothetical protein ACH4FX_18025 [Streptomyces sp. NPDC018019]|uniref:hypothetical protein n=1 Tax=Streptomyces sp. NPDC018019 TaxID=3365030 RepID=UPI00379CFFAF